MNRLPNEILTAVIEYVEEDLEGLLLVCRPFCYVARQLIWSHVAIMESEWSADGLLKTRAWTRRKPIYDCQAVKEGASFIKILECTFYSRTKKTESAGMTLSQVAALLIDSAISLAAVEILLVNDGISCGAELELALAKTSASIYITHIIQASDSKGYTPGTLQYTATIADTCNARYLLDISCSDVKYEEGICNELAGVAAPNVCKLELPLYDNCSLLTSGIVPKLTGLKKLTLATHIITEQYQLDLPPSVSFLKLSGDYQTQDVEATGYISIKGDGVETLSMNGQTIPLCVFDTPKLTQWMVAVTGYDYLVPQFAPRVQAIENLSISTGAPNALGLWSDIFSLLRGQLAVTVTSRMGDRMLDSLEASLPDILSNCRAQTVWLKLPRRGDHTLDEIRARIPQSRVHWQPTQR